MVVLAPTSLPTAAMSLAMQQAASLLFVVLLLAAAGPLAWHDLPCSCSVCIYSAKARRGGPAAALATPWCVPT